MASLASYRWILIGAAICVKMVISIYQYSWFLFAFSIRGEQGWSLEQIALTFTIFIMAATLIQPFSGIYADAYGPRNICLLSALLVGGGMMLASYADGPLILWVCYSLGGLGVGAINGISTATALKWFPDRRGLATGLVEFGFGAGTLLFNHFLQSSLDLHGWRDTFFYLAFFMWAVLIPLIMIYKYPPEDWERRFKAAGQKIQAGLKQYRPLQMAKTHQFLLIYLGFTLIISVVLLFASHMKMIAREFDLPPAMFSFLLIAFPLGNGFARIVAGVVSDLMGRERTMVIFYSLLGTCMLLLGLFGTNPWVFVITVFMSGLLGGAPFVLYASVVGDYFGTKYSTANWGLTITGKAWAGLIAGWLSGFLVLQFGTYQTPLLLLAGCCFLAAVLASPKLLKTPQPERP